MRQTLAVEGLARGLEVDTDTGRFWKIKATVPIYLTLPEIIKARNENVLAVPLSRQAGLFLDACCLHDTMSTADFHVAIGRGSNAPKVRGHSHVLMAALGIGRDQLNRLKESLRKEGDEKNVKNFIRSVLPGDRDPERAFITDFQDTAKTRNNEAERTADAGEAFRGA